MLRLLELSMLYNHLDKTLIQTVTQLHLCGYIYLLSNNFLSVVVKTQSPDFTVFYSISTNIMWQVPSNIRKKCVSGNHNKKKLALFCFTTGGAPYFLCVQEHLAVWQNTVNQVWICTNVPTVTCILNSSMTEEILKKIIYYNNNNLLYTHSYMF